MIQIQGDFTNNWYCSGTRTGRELKNRPRNCAAVARAFILKLEEHTRVIQEARAEVQEQKDVYKNKKLQDHLAKADDDEDTFISIDEAVIVCEREHPKLWRSRN